MKVYNRKGEVTEQAKFNLQFFAEGDAGADEGGADKAAEDKKDAGSEKGKEDSKDTGADAKIFTQADVNRMIQERLARQGKDDKKEEKKPNPEDSKMDDKGAVAGENEALKKAEMIMETANVRIIQATAITEAIKLGIDPKYATDAIRLADLSAIEVDEIGAVDSAAISKSLSDVLTRVPMFKTEDKEGKGFKVGGDENKDTKSLWGNQTKSDKASDAKPWNKFK